MKKLIYEVTVEAVVLPVPSLFKDIYVVYPVCVILSQSWSTSSGQVVRCRSAATANPFLCLQYQAPVAWTQSVAAPARSFRSGPRMQHRVSIARMPHNEINKQALEGTRAPDRLALSFEFSARCGLG